MNIINNIKKWFSPEAETTRKIREISHVFGMMEKLSRSGLLYWDEKSRRLFVSEPLAVLQLRSRETWKGFMNGIFMWQAYKAQQRAWERYMIKKEGEAVRSAKKKVCILTKAEVERIRRNVRDNISVDAVPLSLMDSFDVYIITDDAPPLRDALDMQNAKKQAQIIAAGRYDASTGETDMAMWDDLVRRMKKE